MPFFHVFISRFYLSREPEHAPFQNSFALDHHPAQSAIGKQSTASVIEKARVSSGAAMARVLRPNQPTTLEFNHERLNLLVDGTGRITAVRCG